MTNASDGYLAGSQGLLYPLGQEHVWIGRPRGGQIITEPREEQMTDINTREPLFWDAERTRPKTQLVFTVVCDGSGPAAANGWNTNERVDAADNGHRDVYVKGKDKVEALKAEIARNGLAAQGRPGLRVGDHYYECLTGTRPGKQGTARTWAVMLFPGVGQAQQSFYGNQPQDQAPAAPQAPAGFGQQGPPAGFGGAPQQPAPAAQGNAYGFGHQPPASPGGQAFQQAQQPAPAQQQQQQQWAPGNPTGAAPHPGPMPQFGQPAAPPAPQQAPSGFGQAPQQQAPLDNGYAQAMTYGHQQVAPQGFGQPAPQGSAAQWQQTEQHFAQQPTAPQAPPADDPWGRAPAPNPYGG